MTRDEHRKVCIEVMELASYAVLYGGYGLDKQNIEFRKKWKAVITAALDAIPSVGADVHPLSATSAMMGAGQSAEEEGQTLGRIYRAMTAAGRLTNPPKEKS